MKLIDDKGVFHCPHCDKFIFMVMYIPLPDRNSCVQRFICLNKDCIKTGKPVFSLMLESDIIDKIKEKIQVDE